MGLHPAEKFLHTKKKLSIELQRQSIEWDKIFPNYTSDNGLTFRIYEEIQNN
jgi:beta-glucosidase/6-phospho-beta-glucosidase/beta-galactosidase